MINFEKIANYVLYIGLNDKDTYEQIIDDNFAMQTVRNVVSQRVSGATFSRAFGHWVDEFGNETTEQTIVCKIMYTDDEHIESIHCKQCRVAPPSWKNVTAGLGEL